jgi:hypothetical protein
MQQDRTERRIRNRPQGWLPSLLFLACATACAQQSTEPPASSATPATTAEPSLDPAASGVIDRRGKAGASVFVGHQVTDFDAFKKFFDEGFEDRAKTGVKGHLLTRLDDNRAIVHLFAADLDALKMTLASPELEQYLGRPGGPEGSLLWLAHDDLVKLPAKPPTEPTFSLYLKLRAADLPALRRGFVQHQALFAEHGVIASGIHQSVDQSDLVFLHFVGTARDKLEALAKRAEFLDWLGTRGAAEAPQSFVGTDLSRSRAYYDDFK